MSVEVSAEFEIDLPEGFIIAERYRVERRLGQGGMGAVYLASHVKMGRAFALKVLHQAFLSNPKVVNRFEREATISGKMRHPNVVSAVDVGTTDGGLYYLVMEYVEGGDLGALLDGTPLAPSRIIALTRQICEGLHHAHQHGLIHRDLKPANILIEHGVDGAEVPRIVDFGIAVLADQEEQGGADRLTTHGMVLGTPLYMAPEQATAGQLDHRVDLFALGLIVYEMLSGTVPFEGTPVQVTRSNILLDPPYIATRVPGLAVDPLLEALARRLMEKDPQRRPASARAARELLDLIEGDRVAAARELGVDAGEAARRASAPERGAARPALGASAERDDTMPATALGVGEGVEGPLPREASGPAGGLLAPPRSVPQRVRAPTDTASVEGWSPSTDARRRLRWILVAAAALVAGIVAVLVSRGGAPAPSTVAPPPPAIATAATPAVPPPVEQPEAAEAPGGTAPASTDSGALSPPAPSVAPDVGERPSAGRRTARRRASAPGPTAVTSTPAEGVPASPPPSTAVERDPATPPPATSPPTQRASLTARYMAVGNLLSSLGAQGVDVSDLWNRYRRINKDQAAGDPELKREAMLELGRIESAARARRKP